jgi:hypothetical protein
MHCRTRECTPWIIVFIVFIFLLIFVIPANAGDVYGRVSGGCFRPGNTFYVTNQQQKKYPVATDNSGGYRTSLPSGAYKVTYDCGNRRTLRAWLQSYSQPTRQNIYLQER